jgi:hypothetical protein
MPLALFPDGSGGVDAVGLQGQLAVFFIGHDGALYVAQAAGLEPWRGPERITDRNIAPPGANVVTAHQKSDQLNVLFSGRDGGLYVAWADDVPGQEWKGPVRITPPGVAPPGAALASVKQTGNLLDVFFVANDGALNVSWVVDTGKWQGPVAISRPGLAPAGASSAAVHHQSSDPSQLDVFVNGPERWVAWVLDTGKWNGPIALPN